jgi:hypothetical protein
VGRKLEEDTIAERESRLRAWFVRECDPVRALVDSLDVGRGGVQRWATAWQLEWWQRRWT